MARRKTVPIKGKSTRAKSKSQVKSQKKRKKIAPVIHKKSPSNTSKKHPTPPPVTKKKKTRRKKLKSIPIGRRRQYDDSKPSVSKTTAEKAAIIRTMTDLPFKAVSKFSKAQKDYIDKHYDGLDGAIALRRLVKLKKLKIDALEEETYRESGYVVLEKTYIPSSGKNKGKKICGTYVLINSPHPDTKTHSIKNGVVIRYLDRVEIIINITTPEVYFMLENPEHFIQSLMNENWRVFKKYSHLEPEYKIIYPYGESKHEYDNLENLHHYMNELEYEGREDVLKRISGIAFIYHI